MVAALFVDVAVDPPGEVDVPVVFCELVALLAESACVTTEGGTLPAWAAA